MSPLYYIWKELIYIYIEIQNRFKDFLHKIYDRLEDLIFAIIQKLPEKHIPSSFIKWMEHYTNKRLSELQSQIIRKRWQTIELEKAVDKIHQRQQP